MNEETNEVILLVPKIYAKPPAFTRHVGIQNSLPFVNFIWIHKMEQMLLFLFATVFFNLKKKNGFVRGLFSTSDVLLMNMNDVENYMGTT